MSREADKRFFRVGWLVDGSGAAIRKDVLVVLENSRILEIRAAAGSGLSESSGWIDFGRGTMTPPLLDCHVHLAMSATFDEQQRAAQRRLDGRQLQSLVGAHAAELRRFGILAVRDGGDRCAAAWNYRSLHPGDQPGLLTIRAAGRGWHRRGRYGALIGRAVPEGRSLAGMVAADPEPGDHLKLVQSGLNSLSVYGRRTTPQFSRDELRPAYQAAGRRGQPVMVHANGESPVAEALAAGTCSIEHGFFMGPENLWRLAASDCVWVPTLSPMQGYLEALDRGCASGSREVVRRTLEHQLEQLAQARTLGTVVVPGTDAGSIGVFHGVSLLRELELMSEAGYSVTDVFRSMVQAGARLLGVASRLGRIAPGRPATFLLFAGPPEDLFRAMAPPELVVVDGRACMT